MTLEADDAGGGSAADPAALRRVAGSVDGIATGPVARALVEFMDAMTGVDNCMLDTDFAISRLLPGWEDLLTGYQAALKGFGADLRTVAANFDRAGNSGDLFAAGEGR